VADQKGDIGGRWRAVEHHSSRNMVEKDVPEVSRPAAAWNRAGGEPNPGGLGLATGVSAGARGRHGEVELVEGSEEQRRS
jgi:hypothetical protein